MRLRTRLHNAVLALKGQDVLTEQGLQRVTPDGEIETLGKITFAAWVQTDDPVIAHAELMKRAEREFGPVEWDERLLEAVRSSA